MPGVLGVLDLPWETQKVRPINWLVIHTAATRPSMDIGVREIREWHIQRGFAREGYHIVIRRNGREEQGRPLELIGAHVKGHNRDSIGICLVGGINERTLKPEDNYTPAQWATLVRVLNRLTLQFPNAFVRGHRDFPGVAKACPCFDAEIWAAKHGFRTAGRRRQAFTEMAHSSTLAGVGMTSTGAGGTGLLLTDTAQQLSMFSYYSQWLQIICVGLIVLGLIVTLYAKWKDAKTSPKFPGTAPDPAEDMYD